MVLFESVEIARMIHVCSWCLHFGLMDGESTSFASVALLRSTCPEPAPQNAGDALGVAMEVCFLEFSECVGSDDAPCAAS
mmetsp:Transcript_76038/g.204020  ORF Transcript_76038/g.204020 Transcript_76038/m.204020 type:complete len:80 (-) Transcript_76038:1070-1309(-)